MMPSCRAPHSSDSGGGPDTQVGKRRRGPDITALPAVTSPSELNISGCRMNFSKADINVDQ